MDALDNLREQFGVMFWIIIIGAPLLFLAGIVQAVIRAGGKVKELKQAVRSGGIVTARSEPTTGPLAFGLACGAHNAVNLGVSWNDLSGSGFSKPELRQSLEEMWGVHGSQEWRQVLDRLLRAHADGSGDTAVRIRAQAMAESGREYGLDAWRQLIDQAARAGQLRGQQVPAAMAAAERISRYESRFRADGMLPASGPTSAVRDLRAYDWGRAVNQARWGLRLGYCDRATAERAVLRAGQLCAEHYASWADLSVAFCLGRALLFDDEDFEMMYVAALREPHRMLLSTPDSPWRQLPWPAPARHG